MADAPEYLAVDHISITVSDIEASMRFYVEQLGMPVMTDVETSDKTSNDSRYRPLYDAAHSMRRLVVLGPVGGVKIALIAHPGDSLQGEGDPLLDRVGLNHYALTVRDLPALFERMKSFGVEPAAQGYFRDPDGNLIQFEAPNEGQEHLQAWIDHAKTSN